MKELISEEDVVKIVEKHTKGNYLISKAQAKMISEDVIKRHEEAMKRDDYRDLHKQIKRLEQDIKVKNVLVWIVLMSLIAFLALA